MVRFGTKWPSITSTCSQSAPASEIARTSSPRHEKSAARTDAAIRSSCCMAGSGTSLAKVPQACRVEAVHPALIRPVAGERAEVSGRRNGLVQGPQARPTAPAGARTPAMPRGMRPPGPRIPPAGASSSRRPEDPPAPPCRRRGPAAGPARRRGGPRRLGRGRAEYPGWRLIVPVAEHGASSSTASTGAGGRQSSASASTTSALPARAAPEVLPEPGEAGGGAVEGGHLCAGGRKLRGLAAGRRADLQHLLARDRAEQAGPAAPPPHPAPTTRPPRSP